MPIFDFKCTTCNRITEHVILYSPIEDNLEVARCESCRTKLIQMISAPSSIINKDDVSYTNRRGKTDYGKLQSQ